MIQRHQFHQEAVNIHTFTHAYKHSVILNSVGSLSPFCIPRMKSLRTNSIFQSKINKKKRHK